MRARPAVLLVVVCLFATQNVRAEGAAADPFADVAEEYAESARTLVRRFCLECHSTEKQEGELDLERFAELADVRRGTAAWLKVAEMLDNGEMPPEDAPQPSAEERRQLRGWIERYLHDEALANAGDPGPVVLRRLSNAEYTYTVRDLTGVALDPAREFPADSAAGEGFTNAGAALVMSPALLTKYFDAGKEIAQHAVLLPDGFRFSPSNTRSDWTNELLAQIRELYRRHSDTAGASQVNLQGIVFDTNDGGRLPLEPYLAATIVEREALSTGTRTMEDIARQRGLNAKYLGILWTTLNDETPSLLLDQVRAQWRAAKIDDAPQIAAGIGQWQQALWRFASVGHIGKKGGPTAWQEPVTPLVSRQELRLKFADASDEPTVKLYLVAGDAGDGNDHDFVVWERPRLVAPGQPDLLLRDAREVSGQLIALRELVFASAEKCLAAAAEAEQAPDAIKLEQLAERRGVDAGVLGAWLEYLGIHTDNAARIDSHLKQQLTNVSGYDFVRGWGSPETPSVMANSSDQHVRIPGNMKPHGVAMHPSPTLQIAAAWRSPIAGPLRIEGAVQHAHPECGNGITWTLELRRGNTRQRLAAGATHGGEVIKLGPIESLNVRPGDLVSLFVGPRDGNHACDLTAVDLALTCGDRRWDLAGDVSSDLLAGNPHADRLGNVDVWHFYTEPVSGDTGQVVPAGSLLAEWQAAMATEQRSQLAERIQAMLQAGPPAEKESADAALYRQLSSLSGPLLSAARRTTIRNPSAAVDATSNWGLDKALVGSHPNGSAIDEASLCVQAPATIEIVLPADLAAGCEFVAAGALHAETGAEGSVQIQVRTDKPAENPALLPTAVTQIDANGPWTSDDGSLSYAAPIIVSDASNARRRIAASFEAFRNVFPIALCYTKIVPVDEVVTLTLFYREDEPLRRLMLDDAETARLDRLWEELHFVSHDALPLVDAFQQLWEYATQDADPSVFEPLRKPIHDRAAAFRQELVDAEPRQLEALVEFAARAYRRPLSDREAEELRSLYRRLRAEELPHDEAFRFTLARVFVAPAFLYKLEASAPAGPTTDGTIASHPVSDWELATRLSYFLWSSLPDEELRGSAATGTLHEPEVLVAQAERMLKDPRVERLAKEFGCQWLHIYEFDTLDEKSERHFPEFAELRGDMYEEAIRFFADAFQQDASLVSLFDADHTFVNERLATFYGLELVGPSWQRVDGMRQHGRGGLLGMAATLAKQSGASRTSPILRGNWVSEVLLGEKLPKPPPGVPQLPEDETATEGLTVRQLIEKHSSDERCAKCHRRIDPLGFSLEGFDAIGRLRDRDLADRPIDARTTLPDGTQVEGLEGLRDYLTTTRRGAIVHQFCRKLLGYALGRSVQLSDEPLLAEMQENLAKEDYRLSAAVRTIVRSNQFRSIRAADVVE